ncbi:nitrile hydratase accessory protein [Caballeronia sp. LZ065]|uniref:nitrile hydratase accessory protein n=1 Tax=Caballeronia sp. LZ065 TaxID=3038571 RepID=UPI002859F31B|nr:nitrile hydratase accessory protein [Caballeronia sp. LZ065]MDR5783277.1 nitrile hydratase accessory protein [Caballeronia sp. LZ065]
MHDMTLNDPALTPLQLQELRAALPALPFNDDGPVFRAPWEAQAFAMTLALHERGVFTWQEWAHALSEAIRAAQAAGDPDHGDTYYAHWLSALERLSTAKGCVSQETLTQRRHEWDEAARATPHGQPIVLDMAHASKQHVLRALPAATLDAYRAAIYRIDATPAIDMKIGVTNPALIALLEEHGADTAVFVTACNPFGHLLPPDANATRQRALAARIAQSGLRALSGAGIDPLHVWAAEDSLLVLGATQATADALLTEFEQHAVVMVDRAKPPHLLLHPGHR